MKLSANWSRSVIYLIVVTCGLNVVVLVSFIYQQPSTVVTCDIRFESEKIGPTPTIQKQVIEPEELRREYVPSGLELERLLRLENECDARQLSRLTTKSRYSEMYVSDKFRFVYSLVAKVACTTWKSLLVNLMAKSRNVTLKIPDIITIMNVTDLYLPRLHILNQTQQRHVLKNYFKFVFVREPFDRLISAYLDKFGDVRKTWFPKIYGQEIIKTYRKNATAKELASGKGVTFEEFVQFLVDSVTKKRRPPITLDWHWRPQYLVTQVCSVRYDFIGKFEDLHRDAAQVLKILGVDVLVQFPQKSTVKRSGFYLEDPNRVKTMFAKIPRANINVLRNLYAQDFKLFNYSVPAV